MGDAVKSHSVIATNENFLYKRRIVRQEYIDMLRYILPDHKDIHVLKREMEILFTSRITCVLTIRHMISSPRARGLLKICHKIRKTKGSFLS